MRKYRVTFWLDKEHTEWNKRIFIQAKNKKEAMAEATKNYKAVNGRKKEYVTVEETNPEEEK